MKIIDCPRDAMQGLAEFVPTKDKTRYIQAILEVGFDTIDFGSFVSAKAIPQMRDTAEVLRGLDLSATQSKLLAIIANVRGAENACQFEEIDYLGFPLSISETFQQRNTNKSISEALTAVEKVQAICAKHGKQQVVYVSMGFGNPYGEAFDTEIVMTFIDRLDKLGVTIIALSDTIGSATPELIQAVFEPAIAGFSHIEFGAHLHSNPLTALEKIRAVYAAGCRRLDGAIGGMGGCPMAKDDLTGNIATELIVQLAEELQIAEQLDLSAFSVAQRVKTEIFG